MRRAPTIILTPEEKKELERLSRSRTQALRVRERSQIILLAAEGKQNQAIATVLQQGRDTIARWRDRFHRFGLPGILRDAPRSGRKPEIATAQKQEIIRKTTQETPRNATHWSSRSLAKACGVSATTVRRIWKAHGLKPHRVKGFKLSNDPQFMEKLYDIVGLYLNPPAHAIVLSLDEKSQIQALDRTQPGLPMKKGRCQTMTHDYKRNGTTTLFAALNTLNGKIIGTCMPRHTHLEWLKFLRLIDQSTAQDKELHLIADNYATHKHPKVKKWLARHKRLQVHFTPTSASWLNMVERFFRDITDKRIRRGVFHSVDELTAAIREYIDVHNESPKPFIWTARASDIIEKVKRGQVALAPL